MPKCVQAWSPTRPRGVRAIMPARTRNGSQTSSNGGGLLDRHRQRRHPDRAAAEAAGQRRQHRPVQPVQAEFVDVVDHQCGLGDVAGDDAVGAHLGEVTDPAQQPVGNPGVPRERRAHPRGLGAQFNAEDSGGAGQHPLQLGGLGDPCAR